MATARPTLRLAHLLHGADLAAQLGHARADATAIQLDLRLTGAAAADADAACRPAADLARERLTPTAQPRKQVGQLRELDLRLAVPRAGVLGEDVEDQRGAVDHLDLELLLQLPQLAGRELAVADDGVGPGRLHRVAQLVDLAGTDVGGGVGLRAALDEGVEHLGPRRLGQPGQLVHRRTRLLGCA